MALSTKKKYENYVDHTLRGTNPDSVSKVSSGNTNKTNTTNTTNTASSTSSSTAAKSTAATTQPSNYNTYTPSANVDYYDQMRSEYEDSEPAAYSSKYSTTIDEILDIIKNKKAFDLSSDTNYQQLYNNYAESYKANAQKSMKDALASAQNNTGGYGSTYANAVAQQAYDNTMSGLNDQNLNLMQLAYNMYSDDRANDYNMLSAYQSQDNTDYSRYRDTYNDWYNNRNYYANQYQNEYSNDYGQYRDQVSDQDNLFLTALSYASSGYELPSYLKNQLSTEDQQYFANVAAQAVVDAAKSSGGSKKTSSDTVVYSDDGETAKVNGQTVKTGSPYASGIGLTENYNKVAKKVENKENDSAKYETIKKYVENGTITQEQGLEMINEYGIDVTKVLALSDPINIINNLK